jgi:hypothetical protein
MENTNWADDLHVHEGDAHFLAEAVEKDFRIRSTLDESCDGTIFMLTGSARCVVSFENVSWNRTF